MNFKFNKKIIITILLISSLIVNVVQYSSLKNYKNKYKSNADTNFYLAMQLICIGIEDLKTKEISQTAAIALLSSGTSKAEAIYPLTSHYENNTTLQYALWELNNNITNRTNIEEVINENDLSVLLPALHKLIDNPIDKIITKEFYYLVKKHTVIGSPLP